MSSPNLKSLFNFEEQLEDCLQVILKNAFASEANITVGDPTTGRELPRVNAYVQNVEALDEGMSNISGLGDEYMRHLCTLDIQVVTDNSQEEQTRAFHNQLVGKVRAALLRNVIGVSESNLPYLSVEEIRLADTERRVEGDVTATASMYVLRFSIRSTAWPSDPDLIG